MSAFLLTALFGLLIVLLLLSMIIARFSLTVATIANSIDAIYKLKCAQITRTLTLSLSLTRTRTRTRTLTRTLSLTLTRSTPSEALDGGGVHLSDGAQERELAGVPQRARTPD